jgi:serine/threonine-protein phosphatase 6 regulatory ankyrin repeat subunit A/serine/threonine-protein phosphatase 6 regulatory ankyrin repeat subunit B
MSNIHAKYKTIVEFSRNGSISRVLKIINENKNDVNIRDENGENALIATINSNIPQKFKKSLIILLIKNGININERDNDGNTALLHACKRKQYDNIIILLNNNADITIENNNDETFLSLFTKIILQNIHFIQI